MALHAWLRALDALGGLAAISQRLLAPREEPREESDALLRSASTGGGVVGQLEERLAGVVVAALREAFDRDRARLDLEREHLDAERGRAERALRLEQARQAGDRALVELRLIALLSLTIWITSAVLVAWRVESASTLSRVLLGLGWFGLTAAIASAFVAHRRILAWLGAPEGGPEGLPTDGVSAAVAWFLAAGLACSAASLIVAL